MKCPNKVKVFAWRFRKDSLPTKSALKRRRIIEVSLCPLCGREEETSCHALWRCSSTKLVWKEILGDLWNFFKTDLVCCSSNRQVADVILALADLVGLERMWVTALVIWNQRNAFVMQGLQPSPTSIVSKAREWLSVNIVESHCPPPVGPRWIVPPHTWYKINFDGAMFTSINRVGVSAVMCNDRGEFMAAMVDTLEGALNNDHVKAAAALRAIDVAISIGLDKILLEGDSLRIIQAINSDEDDLSPVGNIISDIRTKSRSFGQFAAVHVPKSTNKVAHRAAKATIRFNEFIVWMEEPLIFFVILFCKMFCY